MEEARKLPKASELLITDLESIFQYGIETFGVRQAEIYEKEIWKLIEGLSGNWPLFSECRHIPTKSKIYRWIILESHFIIYRITKEEIQVLRILNSNRSVSKIRASRSTKV